MIKVIFFTTLRIYLGIKELKCNGVYTISELLKRCEQLSPKPFLFKLIDKESQLNTGVIILVNGQNIHHLKGLETEVFEGDEVALFPPGGGG